MLGVVIVGGSDRARDHRQRTGSTRRSARRRCSRWRWSAPRSGFGRRATAASAPFDGARAAPPAPGWVRSPRRLRLPRLSSPVRSRSPLVRRQPEQSDVTDDLGFDSSTLGAIVAGDPDRRRRAVLRGDLLSRLLLRRPAQPAAVLVAGRDLGAPVRRRPLQRPANLVAGAFSSPSSGSSSPGSTSAPARSGRHRRARVQQRDRVHLLTSQPRLRPLRDRCRARAAVARAWLNSRREDALPGRRRGAGDDRHAPVPGSRARAGRPDRGHGRWRQRGPRRRQAGTAQDPGGDGQTDPSPAPAKIKLKLKGLKGGKAKVGDRVDGGRAP